MSMGLSSLIATLLFSALILVAEVSASHELKDSLTCLDCDANYHFADIKVLVTCSNVKNKAIATTEEDGSFTVNLPNDPTTSTARSSACLARILGGPNQLYSSKKKTFSLIVRAHNTNTYTLSTPLSFYTSCPSSQSDHAICGASNIGSSKTVDFPVPREWGLAPTSYYVPFIPIIGIP